jgi:hypothetical protein
MSAAISGLTIFIIISFCVGQSSISPLLIKNYAITFVKSIDDKTFVEKVEYYKAHYDVEQVYLYTNALSAFLTDKQAEYIKNDTLINFVEEMQIFTCA